MRFTRLRTLAAPIAAVLLVALTPLAASSTASAASTGTCASFTDVLATDEFCPDISWLASHGITKGYPDHGFHPQAPVSREQAAAFLYRLTNPGKAPLQCGADAFPDVAAGNAFCGSIGWLAGQAITNGYADGSFRPTSAVLRQALAALLFRLTNPGKQPPACTGPAFTDVPARSQFCGVITWLAGTGITRGYSDGSFRPTAPVSRREMAAFLHRLDPSLDLRARYLVFGTGTQRVGTDIRAGTYRVRYVGDLSCYWERLRGFSGTPADIIANNLSAGPDVVTISASDKGFTSSTCAVWTTDLRQVSASRDRGIGDGTWIVGTDMTAGRWRASGAQDFCYWERLSSFSGTAGDVIAAGTSATVTISPSDTGFRSVGCGTWNRVG